jgi:3-phosphoshikimate 1-carboxyvinyltransferase
MLKGMGADIVVDGLTTTIRPMTKLLSPLHIRIPADPSSAFFFAVAAAITPNAKVVLEGVTLNKTRIEAFRVLEKMGAKIEFVTTEDIYEPIGNIVVENAPLNGVVVEENISWLIDELPALSIAFACANGVSVVRNAEELRVKESDRISTVVNGLVACGIEVEEFKDGYSVKGSQLKEGVIDSHGDHRIAMSFMVAGLRCGMKVNDVECVNTSFPNFFDLLGEITTVEFL